jgi:hypothetical protein
MIALRFYLGAGNTPLPASLDLPWKGEIIIEVVHRSGFYPDSDLIK